MKLNYPSNSEVVRNIADVKSAFEVVSEEGPFRVLQFDSPFLHGYAYWIVNEKGFLWEPCDSLEAAAAYLNGAEAKEYSEGR